MGVVTKTYFLIVVKLIRKCFSWGDGGNILEFMGRFCQIEWEYQFSFYNFEKLGVGVITVNVCKIVGGRKLLLKWCFGLEGNVA